MKSFFKIHCYFIVLWLLLLNNSTIAQNITTSDSTNNMQKITVEIWSDVMCPFCYIGKRKFEQALTQYTGKAKVEVIWRSFQLNPDLKTDTTKTVAQSLAEQKGWSMTETQQAFAQVTAMARTVGLEYNFDRAVVANSFDAHRLSHLAASNGQQNEVEEQLFSAYFTAGKNTADHQVLTDIGVAVGLNAEQVKEALTSDTYADAVRQDIELARQLGINAVPFFVFNRKYAVSGAQDTSIFLRTLEQVGQE
jgi:predicted DsbA family dithiol-disulfide isomerase